MTKSVVECGLSTLHGTPIFVIPRPEHVHSQEVKRILGATYDKASGVWLFPAYYPFIFDVLHDFDVVFGAGCVQFTPEANNEISANRMVEAELAQTPFPEVYRSDFRFITEPRTYQRQGLAYMLRVPRCGVFYDMGLGKTKMIIDFLRHEKQKALVLAPLVAVRMWPDQAREHGGDELRVLCFLGKSAEQRRGVLENLAGVDVLVAGYDSAKRYADEIMEAFPYTIIVADESHNLRSHDSDRTKATLRLASKAHRRVIMSGTPSLGNPMHLYGQMRFLAHFFPGDFWHFRQNYTVRAKRNPRILVGFKNLSLLNEKIHRVCIRKMKEDCEDLPERTIIDVPFEVSAEQRKMYNELVVEACTELEEGKIYEAPHAAAVLQKLLQILSGFFIVPPPNICDGCAHLEECVPNKIQPYTKRCYVQSTPLPQAVKRLEKNSKLDALGELLDSILVEERNKVIIWGFFTAELDIVAEYLEKNDIRYVRVDGTNSETAPQVAKAFNADPDIRVYLAQIATGVSLTLNSAAYTIYYGLTYKLDEYLQSMDRNLRLGQDKAVFVYRLIASRSVLEFVADALAQKVDIAAALANTINCVLCRHAKERDCLAKGILPFGSGCVHKDRVNRVVTRPELL